ncbi:MAG: hypothetical protein AAFR81_26835 [Chloroflexota bacterium]
MAKARLNGSNARFPTWCHVLAGWVVGCSLVTKNGFGIAYMARLETSILP